MSKKQEDIIKEIKQAYMITFSSKEGKIVLEDLEKELVYTTLLLTKILMSVLI